MHPPSILCIIFRYFYYFFLFRPDPRHRDPPNNIFSSTRILFLTIPFIGLYLFVKRRKLFTFFYVLHLRRVFQQRFRSIYAIRLIITIVYYHGGYIKPQGVPIQINTFHHRRPCKICLHLLILLGTLPNNRIDNNDYNSRPRN